ncbi:unnamed protein product, partial [Hymenolepis diminuta]
MSGGNRLTRRSKTRSVVQVVGAGPSGPDIEEVNGGIPEDPSHGGLGSGASRTEVARFSESQLTIRKVTLNNMGEYRCTVTNPSPDSSTAVIPKIERTFQLHVIPRSEGAIIIGDHDITVHVKSGENLIQSCKVNAEQHRSVTIRWGKIIDPTKAVSAY